MQYWIETKTNGVKILLILKILNQKYVIYLNLGKNIKNYLKINLYRIQNALKVEEDLKGYGSLDTFSYYYIMISPCIGTDLDGISYKPIEDVILFFQKTFLEFSV